MLTAVLFLLLNFAISWYNAWAVGRTWADTEAIGGWPRFMSWCGAVMSACGFTWVYTFILAVLAGGLGHLPPHYVKAMIELGYVIIIFPILGSGLAIWIDSVATAWRERTFGNIATAAWNTYAEIQDVYDAASLLPEFLGDLKDVFSGGDSDDDATGAVVLLVVVLVLIALAGGVLTTCAILKSSARSVALEVKNRSQAA